MRISEFTDHLLDVQVPEAASSVMQALADPKWGEDTAEQFYEYQLARMGKVPIPGQWAASPTLAELADGDLQQIPQELLAGLADIEDPEEFAAALEAATARAKELLPIIMYEGQPMTEQQEAELAAMQEEAEEDEFEEEELWEQQEEQLEEQQEEQGQAEEEQEAASAEHRTAEAAEAPQAEAAPQVETAPDLVEAAPDSSEPEARTTELEQASEPPKKKRGRPSKRASTVAT
mmetsp:Transcript_253/g.407  ORF Transcript_253/g.407 Transcript_253/m.407 type:complete len:233 (-) Transcript_253:192-890(-)